MKFRIKSKRSRSTPHSLNCEKAQFTSGCPRDAIQLSHPQSLDLNTNRSCQQKSLSEQSTPIPSIYPRIPSSLIRASLDPDVNHTKYEQRCSIDKSDQILNALNKINNELQDIRSDIRLSLACVKSEQSAQKQVLIETQAKVDNLQKSLIHNNPKTTSYKREMFLFNNPKIKHLQPKGKLFINQKLESFILFLILLKFMI